MSPSVCVFLCLKSAHELLSKDVLTISFKIAQLTEDIIKNFPRKINSFRDVEKHFDALEAYNVLRGIASLPAHYEFSEELPFSLGVFTNRRKSSLKMAVSRI